jgi:HrpA-like RNA helicase
MPQANILDSMYQLWVLGALDNVGDLMPAGRKISEFPMEPSMAKILHGDADNCVDAICTEHFLPSERTDGGGRLGKRQV